MENKLIRAGDLLRALRDDPDLNGTNFALVKRHIENAEAVDAVKGRWVERIDGCGSLGLPRCSICGSISFTTSNYCQDCGADMR